RAAARGLAAAVIARPHEPRDARRNVLVRALGTIAIERADVLRIAARASERRRVHRDPRAADRLRSPVAGRAHGERDLELRAAVGRRARGAVVADGLAPP